MVNDCGGVLGSDKRDAAWATFASASERPTLVGTTLPLMSGAEAAAGAALPFPSQEGVESSDASQAAFAASSLIAARGGAASKAGAGAAAGPLLSHEGCVSRLANHLACIPWTVIKLS